MAEQESIQLGDVARDTITGFEGVVVGVTQWLHGCRRLTLQPKGLREGKPVDGVTFDEPQIVKVTPRVFDATARTGGPRPEPVRPAVPR